MKIKFEELKKTRGFTKEGPRCQNCEHFTFDTVQLAGYNGVMYKEEKNLRCKFSPNASFKVGKTTYCNYWSRKATF